MATFFISAALLAASPESMMTETQNLNVDLNPWTCEAGELNKEVLSTMFDMVSELDLCLLNEEGDQNIQEIEEILKQLLPSLKAAGIFNLFPIEEWIGDGSHSGRLIMAILYLDCYPQEMSDEILHQLKSLKNVSDDIKNRINQLEMRLLALS